MNINAETTRIQGFVDKGNFHAAYNIALSCLNQCRRENDQQGVDHYIEIIKGIVDTLSIRFSSQSK